MSPADRADVALVGAECEENLALRYIQGSLQAAGHRTLLIPFNGPRDLEAAAEMLHTSGAPLAGFSMVFTYRAREFAALARRVRELGWPGRLVAGGHFAAFHAEDLLRRESAFNAVVVGEGEGPMCALAGGHLAWSDVPGLVWRDDRGRVRRNAPAQKPAGLDALPLPTRKRPPDTYLGLPIANVLSSQGCTRSCAFCSIAAWHRLCGGERHRVRDPAAVAGEMAALWRNGYRIFNFHDDDFVLPDVEAMWTRVRALRRELDRNGVGRIAFAIKSRPDAVDAGLLAYLKEMGLFRVFLGIEAGTDASLRALGRGQTVADKARNRSIVLTITARDVEAALRNRPADDGDDDFPMHIAEMAPAPLD